MKTNWKMRMLPGLLVMVFHLLPVLCMAQIGDPGGDPDAPIDGGVGLLLAAGVGYGIKRYKDAARQK